MLINSAARTKAPFAQFTRTPDVIRDRGMTSGMTSGKGKATSLSPKLSSCLALLTASVSIAALSTDSSLAGNCSGSDGSYVCSGAAASGSDATQSLFGDSVSVTTEAGFGLDVQAGSGFNLVSDGAISITDEQSSTISGGSDGISAITSGSGAVTVQSTGLVRGGGGYGIYVSHSSFDQQSDDLTINAADVTGKKTGIFAYNKGSGAINITSTGTVTGETNGGIYASHHESAQGDVVVSVVDVSGQSYGVGVAAYLNSDVSVTGTGTVTGGAGDGIIITQTGGDTTINVANVSGADNGIFANKTNDGTTTITVSGQVTGGSGAGISTRNDYIYNQARVAVTLNSGADVSAESGNAIVDGDADATVTANTGSKITGNVSLGFGTDVFVFAGGDINGVSLLDGGDDTATEDGFIDRLAFKSVLDAVLEPSKLANWEAIEIDGVDIKLGAGQLTVGAGSADTGLLLRNGGSVTASAGFILNGMLNVGSGSIFNATAGGITINGTVSNAGGITMADGDTEDVMTVNGDFTGTGGVLGFDVVLGDDASVSDRLVITGDFTANALVAVSNIEGSGAETQNGITLVEIGGSFNGRATLVGDYVTDKGQQAVVTGDYAYTLKLDENGNLVLVSQDAANVTFGATESVGLRYEPGEPVYEYYAVALHLLNTLPSYSQRSEAPRSGSGAGSARQPAMSFLDAGGRADSPFWMLISGGHFKQHAHRSTTATNGKSDLFRVEAGVDLLHKEFANGVITGGILLSYGKAWARMDSVYGDGKINTDAYGVGLVASWAHEGGFYIDHQMRYNWFSSDLKSDKLGNLKNNHHSHGFAGSLEIGQSIGLSSGLSVITQAQLTYSRVNFDGFDGHDSTHVSMTDGDRLEMRAGLTLKKQLNKENTSAIYGLVNGYFKFDDHTSVDASGISLSNSAKRISLEVGGGGQFKSGQNTHIFGEIAGRTSFDNDVSVRGTIGVRWSF